MERKQRRLFTIILFLSFICIFIGFIILKSYIEDYNSKIHTLPVIDGVADGEDIHVDIRFRGGESDVWLKAMEQDANGISTGQVLTGIIYSMNVVNKSGGVIDNISVNIVNPKEGYINSAWCGTVEFYKDNGNIVQRVDLRNASTTHFKFPHIVVGADLLIPLDNNETIGYYLSKDAYEVPLQNNHSVECGMIFYYEMGDSTEYPTILADTITFTANKAMTQQPAFVFLMILLVLWIVTCVITVISEYRIRGYVKQKEGYQLLIDETMDTFTGFIDAKDPYTNGHSERVAEYAMKIAKALGYDDEECFKIHAVAQLHDCGKIGIPENILGKPDVLTNTEYEIIKNHTIKGYDILKNFKSLPDAAMAARSHHERYDGKGYPDKLAGTEIPKIARIICIADSFDAMNSDRVYRKRLDRDVIMEQLHSNSGTQFDPEILEVFIKLLEDKVIKF